MLAAFQVVKGFCGLFCLIIYHGNGVFSSACACVREENVGKIRKIDGNGPSGRFDAMFGC